MPSSLRGSRRILTGFRRLWPGSMPLLTALVLPLLAWSVIALTFRRPIIQDVPVVVIDHSASPLSRALIRNLDATQVLRVSVVLSDEESTTEMVRTGEAILGVVIPSDFHLSVAAGGSSEVAVLANGAQLLYSKVAYRAVASTVTTLSAGIQIRRMEARGMGAEEAFARAVPVQVTIHAPGNSWYDYGLYLIPSMAMAILQMSASFSALWLFREHGDRNTKLLLPRGGGRVSYILARGLPLLLANVVAVILLFLVIFPMAGIPYVPAFFPLFGRTVLFVVVCLGMGALLSLLLSNLVLATQVALVINAPAFVFAGFTYPRWAMPDAVQAIAEVIPLTHLLDGLVPVLMFNANVWTGMPGLIFFLFFFWGGVFLLAGKAGDRLRAWEHRIAYRFSAGVEAAP